MSEDIDNNNSEDLFAKLTDKITLKLNDSIEAKFKEQEKRMLYNELSKYLIISKNDIDKYYGINIIKTYEKDYNILINSLNKSFNEISIDELISVKNAISNLDIAYFNAIKELEALKSKKSNNINNNFINNLNENLYNGVANYNTINNSQSEFDYSDYYPENETEINKVKELGYRPVTYKNWVNAVTESNPNDNKAIAYNVYNKNINDLFYDINNSEKFNYDLKNSELTQTDWNALNYGTQHSSNDDERAEAHYNYSNAISKLEKEVNKCFSNREIDCFKSGYGFRIANK